MPNEPDAAVPSGAAPDRARSALRAMRHDGRPDIKTIGAERAAFGDIYFNLLH